MTDGDWVYCTCVYLHCYGILKFTEKQTRKPNGFRGKLRCEEKATTGNAYLKNTSLTHLVELMEFMHYITVDPASIFSKNTLKDYWAPVLLLHNRELLLLHYRNTVPELVLLAWLK